MRFLKGRKRINKIILSTTKKRRLEEREGEVEPEKTCHKKNLESFVKRGGGGGATTRGKKKTNTQIRIVKIIRTRKAG